MFCLLQHDGELRVAGRSSCRCRGWNSSEGHCPRIRLVATARMHLPKKASQAFLCWHGALPLARIILRDINVGRIPKLAAHAGVVFCDEHLNLGYSYIQGLFLVHRLSQLCGVQLDAMRLRIASICCRACDRRASD